MKKEHIDTFIDACMNPIRQRIIQAILKNKEATSAQIAEALSDIPRASLYRHIKILLEADVICVVKEDKRRGAIERTYSLKEPASNETSIEAMSRMVQNTLIHFSADYATYFAKGDCDPQRDMITLAAATILMTDEEYLEFLSKYGQLLQEALQNKPEKGRKERKIAFLSIPVQGD